MQEHVEAVFERWKSTMGHSRARLDRVREKAIRSMLLVGYSVEDLELAIFGCSVSAFHQGQNDRARKYQDISLICRDAQHVDDFIATAEKVIAKSAARMAQVPSRDVPTSAVPAHIMAMVKK